MEFKTLLVELSETRGPYFFNNKMYAPQAHFPEMTRLRIILLLGTPLHMRCKCRMFIKTLLKRSDQLDLSPSFLRKTSFQEVYILDINLSSMLFLFVIFMVEVVCFGSILDGNIKLGLSSILPSGSEFCSLPFNF